MEEFHITHYLNKNRWIIVLAAVYSTFIFIFAPAGSLLYDNALYADIAKNILQSGCFCSNFMVRPSTPPVFPIMVAAFMVIAGGLFIKALLSVIAFLGIMISYHFTMKISGRKRIALLTTVLLFLTSLLIYNSMLLLLDVLFALLVILSIWAYISLLEKGGKDDRTAIFLVAAFTSAAIMTKMVGYLLPVVFVMHFLLTGKKHRLKLTRILAVLVLTAVLLLPWNIWRLSIGPGSLNEVNVGDLLFFGGGYGHISLSVESFYSSGEPTNANPIYLDTNVPLQVVNIVRILVSLLVYLTPLAMLFLSYMLVNYRKHFKGRYDSLLLIWILVFLGFFAFGFIYFGSRYLLPVAFPIIFFFARFIDSKYDKKRLLALLILVIQISSVLAITYADSKLVWSKSQTEIFTQSGEWLKGNTAQDAVVLSLGAPEGALVYYGERKVIGFNGSDYRTVPDYIVKSNFTQSIGIGEYEKMAGAKFGLVKSFSDRMNYSEIYKREM